MKESRGKEYEGREVHQKTQGLMNRTPRLASLEIKNSGIP